MVAEQLILNHLLGISQESESLDIRLLDVEWRIGLDRATMFTLWALERVGKIDCLLELIFPRKVFILDDLLLTLVFGLVKKETLKLDQHGLHSVGRVPTFVPLSLAIWL